MAWNAANHDNMISEHAVRIAESRAFFQIANCNIENSAVVSGNVRTSSAALNSNCGPVCHAKSIDKASIVHMPTLSIRDAIVVCGLRVYSRWTFPLFTEQEHPTVVVLGLLIWERPRIKVQFAMFQICS